MKKVLTLFLFYFLFQQVNSAENDIYKKIDLFGEVLEKINKEYVDEINQSESCLLYTSPSPRDQRGSRMPSSA